LAELAKDPKGWELEDFIAAHFVSRGCYVETGIKERNPDEILELDLFWTDYRQEPQQRHPVEVKSGGWGLGDVFKFYGWTRYLGLEPGEFVHKETCGRVEPATLKHVTDRTGVTLLQVTKSEDVETHFKTIGLPEPNWSYLPQLWRFSFWAQRRLLNALQESIRQKIGIETSKAAKEYHRLINDAVFFIPDIRDRVGRLLDAHFEHQELAKSAAYECETGKVNFANPPDTNTFKRMLYGGEYFPIQACLYLGHRARLYIIKALVDYWLASERGEIPKPSVRTNPLRINVKDSLVSSAMRDGVEKLSKLASFRMLPIFWQVFLWSWGGFLLKDRLELEYTDLERETGVPINEIPVALSAFDLLFPLAGGWFREPSNDSRRVLMLMPAALRGIGAFRRHAHQGKEYNDLGFTDMTANRLVQDNNASARVLDLADADLVK
jgi:hypothetical protein